MEHAQPEQAEFFARTAEWSTETLAAALKITRQRIGQLVAAGVLSHSRPGWFDPLTAVPAYIEFSRRRAQTGKLREAMERRTRAQADLAELDLARRRGDLVEVAVVEMMIRNVIAAARGRLLAMPTKLTPLLVGQHSRAVIQARIDKEINDALASLVNTPDILRSLRDPAGPPAGADEAGTRHRRAAAARGKAAPVVHAAGGRTAKARHKNPRRADRRPPRQGARVRPGVAADLPAR